MTKKVLFFITKSNWGGAQKYVFDLATFLKHMENGSPYVPVVAVGGQGELFVKLKVENISVISTSHLSNSLNPLKLLLSILENIRIISAEKPDLVHTNSSFAGLSIGLACFLTRQKCVFTVHGWPQNEDRNFFIKFILKFAMSWIVFFHNKCICVSQKVLEQTPKLLWIFDQKKKCRVIYNGVDTKIVFEDFWTSEAAARGTFAPPPLGTLQIVTIAELNKNKNHKLILEALEFLPENLHWNYHLIGEGNLRGDIEKQISESKYKDRIFMHGHVANASKYLASFDIFALSSITEAFCFVLVEAGCARLPCIATSVGGIPEIVDDGTNGILVQSRNVEKYSRALEKLITDKNLRTTLGENLFQKVSTNFSKERMFEKTLQIYRSF